MTAAGGRQAKILPLVGEDAPIVVDLGQAISSEHSPCCHTTRAPLTISTGRHAPLVELPFLPISYVQWGESSLSGKVVRRNDDNAFTATQEGIPAADRTTTSAYSSVNPEDTVRSEFLVPASGAQPVRSVMTI